MIGGLHWFGFENHFLVVVGATLLSWHIMLMGYVTVCVACGDEYSNLTVEFTLIFLWNSRNVVFGKVYLSCIPARSKSPALCSWCINCLLLNVNLFHSTHWPHFSVWHGLFLQVSSFKPSLSKSDSTDTAPANWRAGLRKTGSSSAVPEISSGVTDPEKLPRSASSSWLGSEHKLDVSCCFILSQAVFHTESACVPWTTTPSPNYLPNSPKCLLGFVEQSNPTYFNWFWLSKKHFLVILVVQM